jgi:hypothetical protein
MAPIAQAENILEERRDNGFLLRSVLFFLMHQVTGTLGIGFTAPYLFAESLDVFAWFGHPVSMRWFYWILTETPFFPVQIGLGLSLGWMLARRLKQRSMQWVWILPGFFLFYCIAAVPTLGVWPARSLAMQIALESQNPFWHYFGWGCRPKDRCIDQLLITMPFYASVAYSIGARLGLTFQQKKAARQVPVHF